MAAYEQVENFEEDSVVPTPATGEYPAAMDEETLLNFTQGVRARVIEEITRGAIIVQDDKLMGTLNKMLDGMDKQSLGKKRIEASKETSADLNLVARQLEELSKRISRDTQGKGMESGRRATPRDMDNFNYDPTKDFTNITEHEKTVAPGSESSEDFFNRMENNED